MIEFMEVVRLGSIAGAARSLGLERATLSRRLSGLEAELGVRLLYRRTNRLVLTDAGKVLSQRAPRIIADTEEVWSNVRRLDNRPRGLLRVSIVGPYFAQLFSRYLRDFPDVALEVRSTSHHVDLLADGVDVAVRFGNIEDEGLVAKKVCSDRLVAVASPDFLKTHGHPKSIGELQNLECFSGFGEGWTPSKKWPLLNGKQFDVQGRFTANEPDLMHFAAKEGLGCALLPSSMVSKDLKTNTLAALLPEIVGAEIPLHLVFADREYIEPKVRAFVDRAAAVIAKEMPPVANDL